MAIIVSQQFVAFVITSSSCWIRSSKSKEGPGVGLVGGGACGCSGSQGLDAVFQVPFNLIVSTGFDIWTLFRAHLS